MATITFTTTPEEDTAILALGLDATVQDFADRHLRHQVNFAIAQSAPKTLEQKYAVATPEEKAAVDAILAQKAPPPPPKK